MASVLILGAGFTGSRVAKLLNTHDVTATTRGGQGLQMTLPDTGALGNLRGAFRVLHSIPAAGEREYTEELLRALKGNIERIVYLSTTGVYGETQQVDEQTPPAPATARQQLRRAAEEQVLAMPNSMVLRPAAIYGPGRGAHASIREGRWKIGGDGLNYVSRIHVDDLAAQAAAALLCDTGGAWPVADEEPCTTLAITEFCCELLRLPMPASAATAALDETRRADRRVDGSAIRELLGVPLRYPSFRQGIPASIAEENA